MSIETVALEGGRKLQAGWMTTRKRLVGIDTYYIGMLLEYQAGVTGATVGTGTGTGSAVADATVGLGIYTLTFTAALIADLTDPAGVVLAQGLTFDDGAATVLKVGGLTITVTDGGTAFIAGDTITLTVIAGELVALASGTLAGIYNGEDARILSAQGTSDVIVAGEISEYGIVDGAGDTLALTDDQIEAFRIAGFYMKEV